LVSRLVFDLPNVYAQYIPLSVTLVQGT
jgi:hypothetical protein